MAEPKLDKDQRMFALRMHAEGYDAPSIQREIKEKFSIDIAVPSLYDTFEAKKYQSTIEYYKDQYLSKVKAVPIANKRIRLEDLERERQRIIALIQKNELRTKADRGEYIQLIGELRRLIDTAREEMEKKPHLIQQVSLTMGDISDDSLHTRKQELINKLRGLEGRGALGVDPDTGGTEPTDFRESS